MFEAMQVTAAVSARASAEFWTPSASGLSRACLIRAAAEAVSTVSQQGTRDLVLWQPCLSLHALSCVASAPTHCFSDCAFSACVCGAFQTMGWRSRRAPT
eukprot:6180289-Pleurochrysis_carterae.AAC.1